MRSERKRVVLPVSVLLGISFISVMTVSFFITGTHQRSHPFLWKLQVGAIGPLMALFADGGFPSLTFLVGGGILLVLTTSIITGVLKCRMLAALLGAIPLAILWVLAGWIMCYATNLS